MAPDIRQTNRLVVGLFSNRLEAYSAIQDLRDAGFRPEEIGAAFRSAKEDEWFPTADVSPDELYPRRRSEEAYTGPGVTGVGSGAAGAASGTAAVTPAGLSTGGGTTTTGPSRPIPEIPIPHHRTQEPPAVPMDAARTAPQSGAGYQTTPTTPKIEHHQDWWQKTKDLFTSKSEKARQREGIPEDAVKYGTGEGHLPLQTPSAFTTESWNSYAFGYETVSLSNSLEQLGLERNRARYLARQLPPGGAIVTVRTASEVGEAELIMESNSGLVRYEMAQVEDVDLGEQYDDTDRMVVLGDVQRAYCDCIGSEGDSTQKASLGMDEKLRRSA